MPSTEKIVIVTMMMIIMVISFLEVIEDNDNDMFGWKKKCSDSYNNMFGWVVLDDSLKLLLTIED